MNNPRDRLATILLILLIGSAILVTVLPHALAVSGAVLGNLSTETMGVGTGGEFTSARGTITTAIINATQQDQRWKGYVGNVSGILTLDDTNGNTLYDWSMVGFTLTGEVYASRENALLFTGVECAENATVATEQTLLNMTGFESDSINYTFANLNHSAFTVGTQPILENTCRAVALFVNDTRQTQNTTADFQEILLQDATGNLIYAAIINNGAYGFDGALDGNRYDFQLIVAESDINEAPTTYYFYTEIASA